MIWELHSIGEKRQLHFNIALKRKSLMNKFIKLASIAAVLALVAGISLATVEQATAQMLNPTHPDVSRLSPKSFGAATAGIVCGDRLCSEPSPDFDIEDDTPIGEITSDDSHTPSVSNVIIDRLRVSSAQENISYRITFTVTSGDIDLRNIEIEVQSDIDRTEFEISSLNALKSSVNVIRIKALDPDSINGGITGYSMTGPTSSDDSPR